MTSRAAEAIDPAGRLAIGARPASALATTPRLVFPSARTKPPSSSSTKRTLFPNETYPAASLCLALNAMYGAPRDRRGAFAEALLNRVKPPFRPTYTPPQERARQSSASPWCPPTLPALRRVLHRALPLTLLTVNALRSSATPPTAPSTPSRTPSRPHASPYARVGRRIEVQLAKFSEDRIDIAIDSVGHTEGNSLQAFSQCMAPIQMSYLSASRHHRPDADGLPHRRQPHRPSDPVLDARHTEKRSRIDPCFLATAHLVEATDCRLGSSIPNPQSEPEIPAITSGSSTPPGSAVRFLTSRPACSSCLVLEGQDFGDPAIPKRIFDRLKLRASPKTASLKALKGMAEHLALYGRVDIGLDPALRNGTTTTCEVDAGKRPGHLRATATPGAWAFPY